MRILLATPAFGGVITTRYLECFLSTSHELVNLGHQLNFVLDSADALISRSRNKCAQIALDNGFDKLLFIDADTVWKSQDVLTLIESDKMIVGGTYPFKSFPIKFNFNPLRKDLVEFGQDKGLKPFEALKGKYEALGAKEIEVSHLPTGFMLIDVSVFKALSKNRPKYTSWDITQNKVSTYHDFFPVRLTSLGNGENLYETEDWGFCSVAREAGFNIFLNPSVVVDHIGFHQFSIKDALG